MSQCLCPIGANIPYGVIYPGGSVRVLALQPFPVMEVCEDETQCVSRDVRLDAVGARYFLGAGVGCGASGSKWAALFSDAILDGNSEQSNGAGESHPKPTLDRIALGGGVRVLESRV